MKTRDGRGVALVQVLVIVIFLAYISSILLRMTLGRAMTVRQQQSSMQARAVAESAYLRASQCMALVQEENQSCDAVMALAPGTCSVPCGAPCNEVFGTYDLTLEGTTYNVTVNVAGGSSDQCSLSAKCNNCY